MSSEPQAKARQRTRSPAYPSVSLPRAVEVSRKLWDAQRKHEAHIDAALSAMGYSRHGASLRLIAALNHYQLITESGSLASRKIRLSDLALDIIHLPANDERHSSALKLAALSPAIHQSLWERYGTILPEDAAILPFLIRDKGFGPDVAPDIVQNYKESFQFAGLDKTIDNVAPEPDMVMEKVTKILSPPISSNDKALPGSSQSLGQELPILVGGRVANIPFPMSGDDFDLLIGTLNLWRKRLVKDSEDFR